jgi:hypothetical protein
MLGSGLGGDQASHGGVGCPVADPQILPQHVDMTGAFLALLVCPEEGICRNGLRRGGLIH